jgi:hypothetical protein
MSCFIPLASLHEEDNIFIIFICGVSGGSSSIEAIGFHSIAFLK